MGIKINEYSKNYLLYPEFGADKDRDDVSGGGGSAPSGDTYDITTEINYVWIVENGEAIILYFLGGTRHPLIPDKLDGYPVVGLAATAFNYAKVDRVMFSKQLRFID